MNEKIIELSKKSIELKNKLKDLINEKENLKNEITNISTKRIKLINEDFIKILNKESTINKKDYIIINGLIKYDLNNYESYEYDDFKNRIYLYGRIELRTILNEDRYYLNNILNQIGINLSVGEIRYLNEIFFNIYIRPYIDKTEIELKYKYYNKAIEIYNKNDIFSFRNFATFNNNLSISSMHYYNRDKLISIIKQLIFNYRLINNEGK